MQSCLPKTFSYQPLTVQQLLHAVPNHTVAIKVTRSGRVSVPPKRWIDQTTWGDVVEDYN